MNICTNTFYAYSEDKNNVETIINFLSEEFDAEVQTDDMNINAEFDSRWVFPEEEMNTLYNMIPNKSNIYMRCLSVEYGDMYHALWQCDENGWEEV